MPFVYKENAPHGPRVLNTETGRWLSVGMIEAYVAAIPRAARLDSLAAAWSEGVVTGVAVAEEQRKADEAFCAYPQLKRQVMVPKNPYKE